MEGVEAEEEFEGGDRVARGLTSRCIALIMRLIERRKADSTAASLVLCSQSGRSDVSIWRGGSCFASRNRVMIMIDGLVPCTAMQTVPSFSSALHPSFFSVVSRCSRYSYRFMLKLYATFTSPAPSPARNTLSTSISRPLTPVICSFLSILISSLFPPSSAHPQS